MKSVFTARNLVVFIAVFIVGYVTAIGPERFYYESFGTWILSPLIYVRILPVPVSHWLLLAIVHYPIVAHLLCLLPVALLAAAFALAAYSLHRNSLPIAFAAWILVGFVFSVYHYMQPLGITLVRL